MLLSAVATAFNLWQSGIPNRGDMMIGIHRLSELADGWRFGIYYPRLGPNLNFNYGAPLFEFYPPLVSYVALGFHAGGLSLIHAMKATFTLAIALAGAGAYLFARALTGVRAAAWLSAVTYLSAPYLMTNVYERGAGAELIALALLPWLFWALYGLLHSDARWRLWLAAGLVAGILLAHNSTALFFLPAAYIFVTILALWRGRGRAFAAILLSGFLGLGLGAFYWLPALTEVRFTRTEEYMLGDIKNVSDNLLSWRELLQPTWVFVYTGEARFRFARVLAMVGFVGMLASLFHHPRLRRGLFLLALGWLLIMGLQLELARPFWDSAPLIRFIQFSWRLYGLASLCTAILVGALVAWPSWPVAARWGTAVALGVLFLSVSAANLQPDRLTLWYDIDDASLTKRDLFERGRQGYALFSDYTPIYLGTTSGGLTMPRVPGATLAPPLAVAPGIQVLEENPVLIRLAVEAPAPFLLHISRIYFPGWQTYVDGRPVTTAASGPFGLVTAELPAGRYTATVRFDQTPTRRLADGVSIASLAIWGAFVLVPHHQKRKWLLRSGVALAVIVAALHLQLRSKPAHQPAPLNANFQDQVRLLGYSLDDTKWRRGEEVVLRLYWFAQQTPPVNYKVLVHVAELDDSGKAVQADSEPTLGYTPMTTWEPGELFTDEHRIQLEPTVNPGRYRLLIGIYHPETIENLMVESAGVILPGDRLVLTEVEIRDE